MADQINADVSVIYKDSLMINNMEINAGWPTGAIIVSSI